MEKIQIIQLITYLLLLFARHARRKLSKNIICVAPDVGGTERARALGKLLGVGLIVDKRRPKPGRSKV